MKAAAFDYVRAQDTGEALAALADGGGKLLAGGQSLGPMLNLRLARPEKLIDIRRCADLLGVGEEDDALVYGAAITHAAIEDRRAPDATPGWLAPLARRIAYRAVRNRGTIGGSLAHADPAADWPSIFLALDAQVILQGAGGARALAMADFLRSPFATALGPDEILTGLRLPRRVDSARWGYWKFCRKTGEFAKAIGAVLHDPGRGETRAVIGAIERAPVLIPDAAPLIADPRAADALVREFAPGLSATGHQIHAVALQRAAEIAIRAPHEAAA